MQVCKICNYSCDTRYHMSEHKLIHSKKRPKCDECNRDFSNNINLNAHKRKVHPKACLFLSRYKNAPVSCKICERFLRKIEKHMCSHLEKEKKGNK